MHKTDEERAAMKAEITEVMLRNLPVAVKDKVRFDVLVRSNGLLKVTSRVIILSTATGEGPAEVS